jgi:hypothetical protein
MPQVRYKLQCSQRKLKACLFYCAVVKLGSSSLGSAVSTVTRLRQQQEIFIFCKTSRQYLGPPSLVFKGPRCSFPEVKRPGRGVDHTPPSSVEVKNERSYASTPPVRTHGVERDSFTFFTLGSILNVRYIYGNSIFWYFLLVLLHYTDTVSTVSVFSIPVKQSGLEPYEYILIWKLVTRSTQLWCTGTTRKQVTEPVLLRSYFAQFCRSSPSCIFS